MTSASDQQPRTGSTRQVWIWAAALTGTAALLAALFPLATAIDSYGAQQGAALYEAHCASCHGMKLAGQPGWQSAKSSGLANWPAPPLDATGHAWMHDDADLFLFTKHGAPGSPMPAFAATLTDNQIWQIFAYMKSHWPESVRAFQRVGDPYADLPSDLPIEWTYPPSCEPGDAPGASF